MIVDRPLSRRLRPPVPVVDVQSVSDQVLQKIPREAGGRNVIGFALVVEDEDAVCANSQTEKPGQPSKAPVYVEAAKTSWLIAVDDDPRRNPGETVVVFTAAELAGDQVVVGETVTDVGYVSECERNSLPTLVSAGMTSAAVLWRRAWQPFRGAFNQRLYAGEMSLAPTVHPNEWMPRALVSVDTAELEARLSSLVCEEEDPMQRIPLDMIRVGLRGVTNPESRIHVRDQAEHYLARAGRDEFSATMVAGVMAAVDEIDGPMCPLGWLHAVGMSPVPGPVWWKMSAGAADKFFCNKYGAWVYPPVRIRDHMPRPWARVGPDSVIIG